jgi:hypothetical protein
MEAMHLQLVVVAIERLCAELGIEGKRKACMIVLCYSNFLLSLSTPNCSKTLCGSLTSNELRYQFRRHWREFMDWKLREEFPAFVDVQLCICVYPDAANKDERRVANKEPRDTTASAAGIGE